MRNLLEFIKKYYYWLLFIVLEVVAFGLMFRFNHYQGSVWFTAANRVAAEANHVTHEVETYMQLRDVNATLSLNNILLQAENDMLRKELDKRIKSEEEKTIATQRLEEAMKAFEVIPARVTFNSILRNENYLVIDRGWDDGIRPEMGVVCGTGVVGIVFLTEAHHSLVLPTINIKSGISCRIRGAEYFGTLQWNGGSTLVAFLNDVPRYAKIKVGATVETSGFSDVFPPGIFVGRVTEITNAPDGLSLQLRVNLGTDFGKLSDVSVVYNPSRAETDSLHVRFARYKNDA